MSINLGSNPFGLYLGSTKIVEAYVGNVKVYSKGGFTPDIPASNTTIRFKFENTSYRPTTGSSASSNITRTGMGTWSSVGSGTGIWDFNFSAAGTNVVYGFAFSSNKNTGAVDLIGANLTGMQGSTLRLASWNTNYPSTKLRYIYGLANVPALSNLQLYCDDCTGLLKIGDIDLDGIATPSSVESANNNSFTFKGCTNLTSINSIKCSKIGTITFEECNALSHLNLSTNFDYTNYVSSWNPPYRGLLSAFKNCYKLDNALELFNKIKLSRAGKYMAYDTNTFLNAGSTSSNNQLANIPDFIGGTMTGTVVESSGSMIITSSPTNINLTLHPGDVITTYGKAGEQGSSVGTISWSIVNSTASANKLYNYPSGGSGSRVGTTVVLNTGLGFNSSHTNNAILQVTWSSHRPTFSYSIKRYNF